MKFNIKKDYKLYGLLLLIILTQGSILMSQDVTRFLYPVWSPNGEYIAFAAQNDENYQILRLKIADRTVGSLATEVQEGFVSDITWSPDGDFIAYTVIGDNSDIWLVSMTESEPYNLTDDIKAQSENPAWSSNSDRIAFVVTDIDGSLASEIWTVDIYTGDLVQVTDDDGCYTEPEWVRDDNVIVFISLPCASSSAGLYLYDFGEDEIIPISYGDAITYAFSPSEEYIAVAVLTPNNPILTDLILLGDRIRVNLLQYGSVRRITHITWSPLGDQIVFSNLCGLGQAITTINISNYQVNEITACSSEDFVDTNPIWSPDSHLIVYQSDRAGKPDIWLYDLETGEHVNLTEGL